MTSPLASRFPGAASLPIAGIAVLPTPVESLDALARELGIARLLVKRDDLTAPVYGGNKVRMHCPGCDSDVLISTERMPQG